MKIRNLNHKLEAEHFNKVVNELLNVDSDVQTILRGHLYCEASLARLVHKLVPQPEYLSKERTAFSEYLKIAAVSGYINKSTYSIIASFTKLRNSAAHELEYTIGTKESLNFQNAIKGAIGIPDTDSILADSAHWYFQDCSSNSTRLRRCVFFTWVMIELDYSVRCLGVQVLQAINDINDNAVFNSPNVNPELRRGVELLKHLLPFKPIKTNLFQAEKTI
jgi:hypothetical protein